MRPSPCNTTSLSTSCAAASRLPSTRSASNATASAVALSPREASRAPIQAPHSCALGAFNTTIVALASSFLVQAPSCLLLHCSAVISRVTSGGGSAQNAVIALAPSVPGRPVGRRKSINRRLANSDMLAPARATSFQSKYWLASSTSRSP